MEMEMEELKRERDQAQLQLDELRKKVGDDQTVRIVLFLSRGCLVASTAQNEVKCFLVFNS